MQGSGGAGGILSRRKPSGPVPELHLPLHLRSIEPVLQTMLDLAAETKAISEAYLEEARATREVMTEIRDLLKAATADAPPEST